MQYLCPTPLRLAVGPRQRRDVQVHGWRTAKATAIGTSHLRDGIVCQDSAECVVLREDDQQEVLVAVVSDGAGSASRSDAGSRIACELLVADVRELVRSRRPLCVLGEQFARDWVQRLGVEISLRAEAEGVLPREFACTVIAAVADDTQAVFFQIGDGACVYALEDADDFLVATWPQEGEYANLTWFASEPGAADRVDFLRVNARISRIALFSDGLQRVALSFAERTPHAPFFRPLFRRLETCGEADLDYLSTALKDFLSSQQVNSRTDDDKSLVLASRALTPVTDPPAE
ncbi:MAG: protein phosphatase 2C domain-containing protein [Alphaproteobacteria bacterium]|nr:MAG: protein phosphatase 2C domain-containing protein [Alphaproteobacteria bacterium]